jgi:hypothetical protein
MFKKIVLWAVVILIVVVGVAGAVIYLQPAEYRVSRSATMSAPPDAVFAQVNDFHKWDAWSPWIKLDPDCKVTYDGPSLGTGAIFSWSGNDKVGEGRMTITESQPSERILIKLEFIRPFASHCTTEFTFKPQSEQTQVTWTMTGNNNFIGKAFCMVMDMDKMVGGDFEKGLANMKSVVESSK